MQNKLSKIDFHILKSRLSPDWLIKKTNIFEGGHQTAQKFKEYWNAYIKEDLEKVLDDYAKRLEK